MAKRPAPVAGRIATISAALLVGGASSRMGSDKAKVEFEGVAAATHLSHLLAGLFDEVLIVGGDPPSGVVGRRVPDCEGPQCALRGVVTALAAAGSERVLLLATDLPLMTPDVLLGLVAWPETDAVVPEDESGIHPLCALYRREPTLTLARELLSLERLKLRGLLDGLAVDTLKVADLERIDPARIALTNVNTPEDLARVTARLASSQPTTALASDLPPKIGGS